MRDANAGPRGDPTVDIAILAERWITGTAVMYIGITTRPLSARLRELARLALAARCLTPAGATCGSLPITPT